MTDDGLEFQVELGFAPSIVWDALVDDILVEGWLASAEIEPRAGGAYRLNWQTGATLAPTNGVITVFDEPSKLVVDTDNIGRLEFTLASGARSVRNTLLRLRIEVDTDRRLLGTTRAYWLSNFDQLAELLSGRPVNWNTWQRDRGEVWASYRDS